MTPEKAKKIQQQMTLKMKKWDHDIKYVDGRLVEDVVQEYQRTKNEDILMKIINNYAIFKSLWTRQFTKYCDNSEEAAALLHDEIVWRCADMYAPEKALKGKGKAFNAYVVSTLMNQLKNHFSKKRAQKNHPRVQCPICGDLVYQVDAKHLSHVIGIARYRQMFPRYPLVSMDGKTTCPISGDRVTKITEAHLNRVNKSYSMVDFEEEFTDILPAYPLTCPATYMPIRQMPADYPSMIREGYTEDEFIEDYPDFNGIIICPFSGAKTLRITQEHLDDVLEQKGRRSRYTMAKFKKCFPNITLRAKQVDVENPYTKTIVHELTPEMLAKAGTTVMEHLEKYASIILDEFYPKLVICPFTGRPMRSITKKHLEKIGRTTFDFYMSVCQYPLRKWQVKCAYCGEFVSNIWTHLESAKHSYSTPISMEEFEKAYGIGSTKAVVSTNSFFSNDSGDSLHIADLFAKKAEFIDKMEIEDSLIRVANDELDSKIASAIRASHNMEDVCVTVANRKHIRLTLPFEPGKSRAIREQIRRQTGEEDFDFVESPIQGTREVEIMVPGRDEIRNRLLRMLKSSDLGLDESQA